MSGPKSHGYRVSAAFLKRQRLERLRASGAALEGRILAATDRLRGIAEKLHALRSLPGGAQGVSDHVPPLPPGLQLPLTRSADHAGLLAHAEQLERLASAREAVLELLRIPEAGAPGGLLPDPLVQGDRASTAAVTGLERLIGEAQRLAGDRSGQHLDPHVRGELLARVQTLGAEVEQQYRQVQQAALAFPELFSLDVLPLAGAGGVPPGPGSTGLGTVAETLRLLQQQQRRDGLILRWLPAFGRTLGEVQRLDAELAQAGIPRSRSGPRFPLALSELSPEGFEPLQAHLQWLEQLARTHRQQHGVEQERASHEALAHRAGPPWQDRVQRLAQALDADATPLERERVQGLAARVLRHAREDHAGMDLAHLRQEVQAIDAHHRQRRLRVSEAHEALDRARDLSLGPECAEVQALLLALSGMGSLEQALPDLERRMERERPVFEQRYVAEALGDALETLGYQVEEAFSTLFVQGGEVFVQKPRWGTYRLRIRNHPQEGRLHLNMVRTVERGESAEMDRQMEEVMCQDHPRLLEMMREEGVEVEPVRQFAPGEKRMQVVALGSQQDTPSRRVSRKQALRRQLR